MSSPGPMLLLYNKEEAPYLQRLNDSLSGSKVITFCGEIITLAQLLTAIKSKGITQIITTRQDVLLKLLPAGREKAAKISNYAGSIIPYDEFEFLIIPPLSHMFKLPYGKWMIERFLTKFTKPENWRKESAFSWSLIRSEEEFNAAYKDLSSSNTFQISVDIETLPNRAIESAAYCGFRLDDTSHAYVIECDEMHKIEWLGKLNSLPQPKVLQNGKYDIAYFFAYNIPLINYICDTKNAMHAWLAELPKDLAFLSALLIRNSMYWKDLGSSGDKLDRYRYNALDTWSTGEAWLGWMNEAPKWAWNNYIIKFPQVPIAHRCEMLGIKRDLNRLAEEEKKLNLKMDRVLLDLQIMTDEPKFNPSSPKQVVKLLHTLGHKEAESSDEPTLQKYIDTHPLSERVLGEILEYRGTRKLVSTYLTVGEKAKEFKGRILFASNPDGTDTGRSSSREHHFWCGLQMQNIPREGGEAAAVKDTLVADEDFVIFEADYSQAEARGVAYSSGDQNLLDAVESGKDFHSLNASSFFGIPYEELYDDEKNKTLNKDIRDLSKRVNHGANYNMGEWMLLITMGEKNVRKAQRLLNLPKEWSLQKVCGYLLNRYEKTYPKIKTGYYQSIKNQVAKTSRLVGATGWTRYCFGNPSVNKNDLNAYVAHVTQSLNAMILDEAMLRVFLWQRKENNWNNIKIIMQIHDSILGQVRKGHEHLAEKVRDIMEFKVPVTDYLGVTRDMLVPVDLKIQGHRWSGNE